MHVQQFVKDLVKDYVMVFHKLAHVKDLQTLDYNFLGIDLCVVAFANHIDVTMCIHVKKCSAIGRFLTNFFDQMALNQGLD
jgi:hypothetical protein